GRFEGARQRSHERRRPRRPCRSAPPRGSDCGAPTRSCAALHHGRCRYACRTCLAIGAATLPPVASLPREPPSKTITATAIVGVAPGAAFPKHTNHAFGAFVGPFVAVPVLPATWMFGIWAAVPVPACTTPIII